MRFTITMDAADATALARFWKDALGYVDGAPPTGWDTWEQWRRDHEVPEEEWGDGATIVDPDERGASITFLKVPEPKTVKNRLHLDLQASGGRHLPPEVRLARIRAVASRLVEAGATTVQEHVQGDRLDHIVLADPEGNEFCVV